MKIGQMVVLRNHRTHVLHKGFEGAAITLCNGSGQTASVRGNSETSAMDVATTSDSMFCKRCFKPADIQRARDVANEILEGLLP